MRRIVLPALLVILALAPSRVSVPLAQAATVDVCASGCRFQTIQAAINASRSGDTIRIGPGAYREALDINKDLTLVGFSSTSTILTTPHGRSGSIITIDPRDTVTLSQLHTIGGGVGVFNLGTVTLDRVTVTDNGTATGDGGGIVNRGTAVLINSEVRANIGAEGGGISNQSGTLTLDQTSVFGNRAELRGGGILNAAILSLKDSKVEVNEARIDGGGVFNAGGTVTLTNTQFRTNEPNNCVNVPGCPG